MKPEIDRTEVSKVLKTLAEDAARVKLNIGVNAGYQFLAGGVSALGNLLEKQEDNK
jgi:hypothetical protein